MVESSPRRRGPTTAGSSPGRRAGAVVAVAVVAVVAVVVRAAPLLRPGALTSVLDYDEAVAFTAATRLLHGEMPYRDFVLVHPPGSVLAMVPFVAAGSGHDALALGVARLGVCLLGGVNAALVAVLLRRHGVTAMLVGGGLYATWQAVAVTEGTVLLEPALTLATLTALLAIRSTRTRAVVTAGIALGLATAVKYWAVVDVLVVGLAVLARAGRPALMRYATAAVGAGALVVAPFLLTAPGSLLHQTVTTQLTRPAQHVDLDQRLLALAPVSASTWLVSPGPAGLALWAGLLALGGWTGLALGRSVLRTVTGRLPPSRWPEELLWLALALVHLVLVAFSASFYPHYLAWAVPYLALLAGWSVGNEQVRGWVVGRLALPAVVAAVALVVGVGALARLHTRYPPQEGRAALVAWADGRRCVWGFPPDVVAADHATANASAGCAVDVDPLGTALSLGLDEPVPTGSQITQVSPRWHERTWPDVLAADGVLLPTDRVVWWFDADQVAAFEQQHQLVASHGDVTAWQRTAG